jgi:serine/threonine-protein kinase
LTLEKGRRIGPYEVVAPLGAGGMGEVWRATDTRLGRDVALKLLPAAFASDPDRLARFEREAKLLASLSHTHIAGLFALEEATLDGSATPVRFLAMELAEGEDLAERLKRGAIPVDEAIAIAKQIAEALEAAHEKGIVHRDLKPANVKVSAEGHVKVLDFGLAKAWSGEGDGAMDSADGSQSPTLARTGTAAGLILGTAAYMSPEQARGKPVDKRADIWSFGVVLFEMLTGQRLFDGETVSDVLAAVLTREPQWNELPATTPPSVRRLLRHCLERNPKNRQHDIADARVALDEALTGLPEDATAPAAARAFPPWRRVAPWAGLAGVLALTQALGLWVAWRKAAEPPPPLRLSVQLGVDATLAGGSGGGAAAIPSPDGRLLAFTAREAADRPRRLYIRPLHELAASPLSGTEGAQNPFFSPDSQWVGFFAEGKLKKAAVAGGAPVTLCDAQDDRGGAWSEDGTIVFMPRASHGAGLSRVSSAGGTAEILTTPDQSEGPSTDRWPQVLPGGRAVLYTSGVGVGDYEGANIVVMTLPNGPRKIVQRGGYYCRYLRSGYLAYIREGTLLAAPFDLERLELTGPPVPVVPGVSAAPFTGGAQFAVSDGGTLVFVPGQNQRWASTVHWLDSSGETQRLGTLTGNYSNLLFSPDGQKLALDLRAGREWDVWVYDWTRDTASRLTVNAAEDRTPVWTPDGLRIAFASTRGDNSTKNLYWQRADGTGDSERLTESEYDQFPRSWHPGGRLLAFAERRPKTGWDISVVEVLGNEPSGVKPGKPVPLLNGPFDEVDAVFSPDGRWLAYASNETGRLEVYVRPFPAASAKWQISSSGGTVPTWSRERQEFFFLTPDGAQMVAAYTPGGDSLRVEKPRRWSPGLASMSGGYRNSDLHPDGQRFAVIRAADERLDEARDHVVFVQNFFDELRRLAPPKH